MTVSTTISKVTLPGNGAATTFSFNPIVIFSSSDLSVVTTIIASGIETVRLEGTGADNWSLGLTTFPATGSITYPANEVTPLPSTETITISLSLTIDQQTDLNNQGGYFADVQETAFDKLTLIAQQQQEQIDRSFTFPISYTGAVAAEIPAPSSGDEGKVIGLNGSLTALVYLTPNSDTFLNTPSGSTDEAIVRFDGTTGQSFQDSLALVNDLGEITSPNVVGRNLFINGDMVFDRRVGPHTVTGYTLDRFFNDLRSGDTGAGTVTREDFTIGQTDVPGAVNYMQHIQSSGTATLRPDTLQRIENVEIHSGTSITVSWRARVTSGTMSVLPQMLQNFGSGGSSDVAVNASEVTYTTTWTKFTKTFTVPSVSGKTIGAGNYLHFRTFYGAAATFTVQTTFWKSEFGTVATPFSLAGGSIAGELILNERYYKKSYDTEVAPGTVTDIGAHFAVFARNASNQNFEMVHFTAMRATPTAVGFNPASLDASGKFLNETDTTEHDVTMTPYVSGLKVNPTASTGVNTGDVWKFQYTLEAEL